MGWAPPYPKCQRLKSFVKVIADPPNQQIGLRIERKLYRLFNSIVPIINILSRELKMLTRRDYLKYSALLGAACALPSGFLQAFESKNLITRAIPKTGEKLPRV